MFAAIGCELHDDIDSGWWRTAPPGVHTMAFAERHILVEYGQTVHQNKQASCVELPSWNEFNLDLRKDVVGLNFCDVLVQANRSSTRTQEDQRQYCAHVDRLNRRAETAHYMQKLLPI